MGIDMKEILKKIFKMDMEKWFIKMVMCMKESGKWIGDMVRELLNFLMVHNIQENGKMTFF